VCKGKGNRSARLTRANSTMELWVRGLGIERITAGWLKAYSWSRPSAIVPGRMFLLAGSQTMHPGDTWPIFPGEI
jgi:hypothetical protein